MKNKNNKGFVLIEAIMAIILFLVALLIFGGILSTYEKTSIKADESIVKLNVKRTFNQIEYLKDRLMVKGTNTFYLKNNEKYAGWNILKISPSETLNDLSGYYKIETNSSVCSTSSLGINMNICLRRLGSDEFGYYTLKGETEQYEVKGNGEVLKRNETHIEKNGGCDKEDLGKRCLSYKIFIENLPNSEAYKKKSYIRSDGVTVVINSAKLLTIELKSKNGTIKKYKHLLNIY